MTTTIRASGSLYVGPVWPDASFTELFTVLHVLVVGVFVLSLVATFAAMAAVAFEALSGRRGCEPSRTSVLAPVAMVVSFVTGASITAWAAAGGPGVGLLTLLVAGGLVAAAGCCIAWRQRRWWASYSAAQSAAGAEGQR